MPQLIGEKYKPFIPWIGLLLLILLVIGVSAFLFRVPQKEGPKVILPEPSPSAPKEPLPPARTGIVGKVIKVEPQQNAFQVKDSFDQNIYTVQVAEGTEITQEGNEAKISLPELEVGDSVSVKSEERIGTDLLFEASSVQIIGSLPEPVAGERP